MKFFPDTPNQEDMHLGSEYYIMLGKPSDSSSCQLHEVLMRAIGDVKKAQVDLEQEISNGIVPSPSVVGFFKDLRKNLNVNINRPKRWRVTWY